MEYPQSPLMGQMMIEPLMISSIIRFAARHYGSSEIVSRRTEPALQGELYRGTYRDCERRARRLAHALEQHGVRMGEHNLVRWLDGFIFFNTMNGELDRLHRKWLGIPMAPLPSL